MRSRLPKLILICLLSFSTLTCAVQKNSNLKADIIQTFMNHPYVLKCKSSGKIVIVKMDYCEAHDCTKAFEKYKDELLFYTMEEVFMRGLTSYVFIEELDQEQNKIVAKTIKARDRKVVEIKL